MPAGVIRSAQRARYVAYVILTAVFTLLIAAVTIRFALQGGDAFEVLLLAGLTLLLAFQTRRWYRRLRATEGE